MPTAGQATVNATVNATANAAVTATAAAALALASSDEPNVRVTRRSGGGLREVRSLMSPACCNSGFVRFAYPQAAPPLPCRGGSTMGRFPVSRIDDAQRAA